MRGAREPCLPDILLWMQPVRSEGRTILIVKIMGYGGAPHSHSGYVKRRLTSSWRVRPHDPDNQPILLGGRFHAAAAMRYTRALSGP